jgi:hypothetical protein
MIFIIDYDDNDNYSYNNTILMVRGSQACFWNEVYTAIMYKKLQNILR